MALVSITRNTREPSTKTQAGVELSRDLSWVVKHCYVLLSDEHECVCTWEGRGLMDVKSRKNPKSLLFLFLSHAFYKKFIIPKTKDLKKYLRHQEKNKRSNAQVPANLLGETPRCVQIVDDMACC